MSALDFWRAYEGWETPNTADNKFSKAKTLEIYHDEGTDDKDDDTDYIGTARSYTAQDFTATQLRLSIKGYVANDGNKDKRARGNEAVAGVTVELLEAANAKDTAFTKVVATEETDARGLYSFDDLEENKEYKVRVVATDEHAGLRSLNFTGLLEGYYYVAYTGSGYAPVRLDADGKPDDDVSPTDATDNDATNGTTAPESAITVKAAAGDTLTLGKLAAADIAAQESDGSNALTLTGDAVSWAQKLPPRSRSP